MKAQGIIHALQHLLRAGTQKRAREAWADLGSDYATDPAFRDLATKIVKMMPKDKKRSLNQNALLHKWFEEIAEQTDGDAREVKAHCNLTYGVPICSRDEDWLWVWENSGAMLEYENRKEFCASEIIRFSSGLSKPCLKEYMDAMHRDYTAQGVKLSMPEERP